MVEQLYKIEKHVQCSRDIWYQKNPDIIINDFDFNQVNFNMNFSM